MQGLINPHNDSGEAGSYCHLHLADEPTDGLSIQGQETAFLP